MGKLRTAEGLTRERERIIQRRSDPLNSLLRKIMHVAMAKQKFTIDDLLVKLEMSNIVVTRTCVSSWYQGKSIPLAGKDKVLFQILELPYDTLFQAYDELIKPSGLENMNDSLKKITPDLLYADTPYNNKH